MASNKFKTFFSPPVVALGEKNEKKKFSAPPVIIGGCGRSGTTLLLSILGAHPSFYAVKNETGAFLEWEQKKINGEITEVPIRIDRLYRYILTRRIPPGVSRWCEKTPGNIRHIENIIKYFNGKVKIIHIVRDGRDVMLSKHPKDSEKYWITPQRWVRDVKAGLKFKGHPSVLTVKYEKLVKNFHETVQKICDFTGENFTEKNYPKEIMDWTCHTNIKKSRSWRKSVRELDSGSIGKWKKPQNRRRAGELLKDPKVKELLKELEYIK
jgi:hypothetical protein